MFANSRRIREIFSHLRRRKHQRSIFFSDQLLETPLAFDLLNPVNERSLTTAMLGAHPYLQITRERTATRPLGSTESPHGME